LKGVVRVKLRSGLIGAAVALALVLIPLGSGVALAAPDARAHVDGIYKITSTDCYFGAGACTTKFDIEMARRYLHDKSDKYFWGHVRGDRVKFGEAFGQGTSEDSWGCTGYTKDGGKTISGMMWDGLGGSGTFVLKYLGP
jgi:hypothetical protein